MDGVGGWHSVCHSVILAFPSHCYHTHTKGIQDAPTGTQSFFFLFTMLCPLFNPHLQQAGVEGLVFTSVT